MFVYPPGVRSIYRKKHRKFLLHTKIVYHLKVCRDFDPKSFKKVQGIWKDKCKIGVRSIYFLWRNIWIFYCTQKFLITWGCVMTLTQSHLSKFKVTGKKSGKLKTLSYGESTKVLSLLKNCLSPKDKSWFCPKVICASSSSLERKSI